MLQRNIIIFHKESQNHKNAQENYHAISKYGGRKETDIVTAFS
jgi:hypothetical protein